MARVQIEIDLLKPCLEKIWIGVENGDGFWQKLEYEDYCQHSWHVGHSEALCHIHNPELKAMDNRKPTHAQGKKQVYVPKSRPTDPSGSAPLGSGSGKQPATIMATPPLDAAGPSTENAKAQFNVSALASVAAHEVLASEVAVTQSEIAVPAVVAPDVNLDTVVVASDVSEDDLVEMEIRSPLALQSSGPSVGFPLSARAITDTKDGNVIDLSAGILEHRRVATAKHLRQKHQAEIGGNVSGTSELWCGVSVSISVSIRSNALCGS